MKRPFFSTVSQLKLKHSVTRLFSLNKYLVNSPEKIENSFTNITLFLVSSRRTSSAGTLSADIAVRTFQVGVGGTVSTVSLPLLGLSAAACRGPDSGSSPSSSASSGEPDSWPSAASSASVNTSGENTKHLTKYFILPAWRDSKDGVPI